MIYFARYFGFGICSFAVVLFFFPLVLVRPFDTRNSYVLFRNFRKLCSLFLGIELHIKGYEKLLENRPSVVIANHQHTYDILTLGAFFTPFMTSLGKFEILFIPILGQFYALAGNTLIKRKNREKAIKSMDLVEKKLKTKKLSVLIFPEGHRNPLPQLTIFKKGAFRTAINTGFPIIPIAISQYRHLENFNKFTRCHIYIEVLDPIVTKEMKLNQIDELLEESRNQMVKAVEKLNLNYQ